MLFFFSLSLSCSFVCCCCYLCFVPFGIAFSCRSERRRTSIQDMGGGTSIIRYRICLGSLMERDVFLTKSRKEAIFKLWYPLFYCLLLLVTICLK
ncbi:hypothetical protein VIGAN_08014900 [Vigna angularis var. angularis]|uniref:Uncharacterized protein n=1 Tax=Vigna angularis var. angularis TaxID=157739 RepID=A0A0S3SL98_PHAAN|nr:hypothetical protein VIGAN_08014900 [Vigna angularis var. angularis]